MSQGYSASLFENLNAAAIGAAAGWNGGRGVLTVAGAFGGTSVTLEYLGPDGATWLPVRVLAPDGSQTTVALVGAGMFAFDLPPGQIRARANGGAPAGLYALAARVIY